MDTADIEDFEGYMTKLASEFSEDERAWFVDSFARHMKYRSYPRAFVVSIDDVVTWLAFTRKESAVRLLKDNFSDDSDFTTASANAEAVHNGGGHNKVEYMLSIETFKHLCLIAKTAKAKVVRGYYIKMEQVLMTHLANHNIKVAKQNAELKRQLAMSDVAKEIARSEGLIKGNSKTRLAYLLKLVVPTTCNVNKRDDEELYKWGQTDGQESDLASRVAAARCKFGVVVVVVEIFRCVQPRRLEKHFLEDYRFSPHKFSEVINKSSSTEVFKFTTQQRNAFILAVSKEYTKAAYQGMSMEERRLLLSEKALELQSKRLEMLNNGVSVEDIERVSRMSETQDGSSGDAVLTPASKQTPARGAGNGDLVYIYDPHNLVVHKGFFPNIIEATRAIPNTSHSNIKEAVRKCTVYRGYRWQLVQKGSSTIPRLPPTIVGQQYRTGYVARMSDDLSKVLDVKSTQAEWAKELGVTAGAISMSLSSDKYSYTGDVHLALWDKLDADVQKAYLNIHPLPERPSHAGSKVVVCINVATGEKTIYDSLTDLKKKTGVTRKVLDRCMADSEWDCKGYRYLFG